MIKLEVSVRGLIIWAVAFGLLFLVWVGAGIFALVKLLGG